MRRWFWPPVLLLLAAPHSAAAAQQTDTLTLAEVLEAAREGSPAIRAVRLAAEAAGERVAPAGALPDPMLMLGLRNRPFDLGTGERMTANAIELSQRFPWPGKLGFGEDRERRLAEASTFDADELEAELLARVKTRYYELAYLDRAIEVMRETRDLLRQFFDVSSALYAVGEGLQQDVLQAQIAIAQVTEQITVAEQQRVAGAARLNALIGREATQPVGALHLPSGLPPLPTLGTLMDQAAGSRPAILAARARVDAAEAGRRAAARAKYPDVTVTLGYGQRPEFEDLFSLMLGVNLPLWSGAKYAPREREMRAMRAAADARATDLWNETYAQLAELRAEAEQARNLSSLYAESVLPQARAAVESALSAYRVGNVDFMTLLNNEMTVNRYEIEVVRLTAAYYRAVARIDALTGVAGGGDA